MLQRLYQGVVSSATTLLIGRSFGNIIRVIENSLIEKANEEYGEKLVLEMENMTLMKMQYNLINFKKERLMSLQI